MVTTVPVLHGARGGTRGGGGGAAGESKCSHDGYGHGHDGGESREGVVSVLRDDDIVDGGRGALPAARLVSAPAVQAIAIPCNSR